MAGVMLGAFIAVAGGSVVDASRYLVQIDPPSAVAVERPMSGFTVDPSWIRSGRPNFRATETVRSPDGRTVTVLLPGDTATFHAGTKAVWYVPSHAKKAYTLQHPGKLVLLWRWLFSASA
jgi:hypothetical protein